MLMQILTYELYMNYNNPQGIVPLIRLLFSYYEDSKNGKGGRDERHPSSGEI